MQPMIVRVYTQARRFPRLVGKMPNGSRIPGGPYTFSQFTGVALGLTITVLGIRAGLASPLTTLGFGIAMTFVLAVGLGHIRYDGLPVVTRVGRYVGRLLTTKPRRASDLVDIGTVIENFQIAPSGVVTATYFVNPLDYGLKAPADKMGVQAAHDTLGRTSPNDTLLLGLQVPRDIVDVLRRMVEGVDLEKNPAYLQEAIASFHRVGDIGPMTRLMLVNMPIADTRPAARKLLGYALPERRKPSKRLYKPTPAELEQWRGIAEKHLNRISPSFKLQPVPETLLPVFWDHCVGRGVAMQMFPVDPTNAPATTAGGAIPVVHDAALDEGANTDRSSFIGSTDPALKVIPYAEDLPTGYQQLLTIPPGGFPFGGAVFPGGSEFLSRLDGIVDSEDDRVFADFAIRYRRRDRETVMAKNARSLRQIDEQFDQREGQHSFHEQDLGAKVAMLSEYNTYMSQRDEVEELGFTVTIAVGAPSRKQLDRGVAAVRHRLKEYHVTIDAPIGGQADLWASMFPGSRRTSVVNDYEHFMPSDMFAGFVPFTTARIGDEAGPVVAVNLLSGQEEPVHLNFMRLTLMDVSSAIAVAGDLGSGKSHFLKTIAALVHDLGGQFLAFDRSTAGEWVVFSRSLTKPVIVDLANPNVTVDPLRNFDMNKAKQLAADTILPLLDIAVTDDEGQEFINLLTPTVRERIKVHSLPDLLDYLTTSVRIEPEGPDAPIHRSLARALRSLESVAPSLFDRDLPPMDLSAAATIIRTHNLLLPTAEEMANAHSYRRLSLTKRLGHALYALTGQIARQQFLQPNGRYGLLIGDEAHHFTNSDVGKEIISDFARDGRKHLAGIILASHSTSADFKEKVHRLFPVRIGFRQVDEELAKEELTWLGVDIERDPWLVKELREQTSPLEVVEVLDEDGNPVRDASGNVKTEQKVRPERRGECYMRDSRGRIGRIRMLGPAREDRFDAVSTTPVMAEAA